VRLDSALDRPLIALTLGDPAGIGPEIACAALQSGRVRRAIRLVVLGPAALRPDGIETCAPELVGSLPGGPAALWVETPAREPWVLGRAQASAGRAALAALELGHRLAMEGRVSALVTGPVCKQALALAGERVEGQTELLARWSGAERTQMLAVAGSLRVLLLTRHLPLREALEAIDQERVLAHLELLDEAMREFGFGAPRIALAGLNPHAGESGLLGVEEGEVLAPAVREARAKGLNVTGPMSPDALFARAAAPGFPFDAVLALYHDQGFIPVKLLAPGRALTVLVGLPYLRVSPAHGTAFDIAGTGAASAENLVAALLQAAEWSRDGCARGAPRGLASGSC